MRQRTGTGEFSVGEVLRTAANLLGRKVGVFAFLSLVGIAPMLVGTTLTMMALLGALAPIPPAGEVGIAVLGGVVVFAGFGWSQAAIIYFGVRTLRAEPPTVGQTALCALRKIAPVVAVTMLAYLAVGLGILFLIVPGVVLFLMLWAAVPAAVVEGGVVSALERSHQLTKGHKWALLGLFVVVALAIWFGTAVLMIIEMVFATAGTTELVVTLGVALITQAFALVVWGVVGAASYYHLRLAAEGEAGDVAEVFR